MNGRAGLLLVNTKAGVPSPTMRRSSRLWKCVEWKGKRSQTFDLDVTSNEELIAKLKTEIAKFKLMIMTGAFK